MSDDRMTSTNIDEILSRAVDRQIAEQRALRQSLDELRESVTEATSRPARVDLSALEERLRTLIETNSRSSNDTIRSLIETSVLGASESTFASLSDQLRSFREAVVPRLEQGPDFRSISEELAGVREAVGGVSTDLEGIAQALIDFNSGLRQWASGLDESVSSIRLTVGELYAVATQPPPIDMPEPKQLPERTETSKTRELSAEDAEEVAEPSVMVERIRETAELSEYLADQIEDLDGLMGRLTELPVQLEGVVSQALKRTLTARAKLDREAESALDEVLEALDEHVNQLTHVLERFEQEEDQIRKLALEQVELSSRIESLQETVVDRVERAEVERRRSEEAIAVAIDRTSRGLQPRALESLSKSTKRRAPIPPPLTRPLKAKSKAKSKAKAAAPTAKEVARKEPKRKPRRSSRRQDWTPLPSADDE